MTTVEQYSSSTEAVAAASAIEDKAESHRWRDIGVFVTCAVLGIGVEVAGMKYIARPASHELGSQLEQFVDDYWAKEDPLPTYTAWHSTAQYDDGESSKAILARKPPDLDLALPPTRKNIRTLTRNARLVDERMAHCLSPHVHCHNFKHHTRAYYLRKAHLLHDTHQHGHHRAMQHHGGKRHKH